MWSTPGYCTTLVERSAADRKINATGERDGLALAECFDAFGAKLAANARALEAAEWAVEVHALSSVHAESAGANLASNVDALFDV